MKKYILWAFLLGPLGFATHSCLTAATLSKQQVELKEAKNREKEAKKKVENVKMAQAFLAKMVPLAQKVSRPPTEEKPCPEDFSKIEFVSTDAVFFEHFASGTYSKTTSRPETENWYTTSEVEDVVEGLNRLDHPENIDTWDWPAFLRVRDLGDKARHYLVLYPTGGMSPPLFNDPKGLTFVTGHFDGWQALIDAQTGETLCAAKLSAANTENLEFRQYRKKLARLIDPYGNIKGKVQDDLEKNFWAAVRNNLAKRSSP